MYIWEWSWYVKMSRRMEKGKLFVIESRFYSLNIVEKSARLSIEKKFCNTFICAHFNVKVLLQNNRTYSGRKGGYVACLQLDQYWWSCSGIYNQVNIRNVHVFLRYNYTMLIIRNVTNKNRLLDSMYNIALGFRTDKMRWDAVSR